MLRAISETEISVTWTASTSQDYTKYKVTASSGGNIASTKTAEKGSESAELTGLTAATEYIIAVVAVNGDLSDAAESDALTGTFYTSELLVQ